MIEVVRKCFVRELGVRPVIRPDAQLSDWANLSLLTSVLLESVSALKNLRHVAVVAQLVEHLHGKEKVTGPIPVNGSEG